MLAGRRHRRVGERGNHDVNVRTPRVTAVFGVVVGALHVFHAGRNGNRSAQMRARPGQAFEIGQRVEREIHFS